MLDAAAWQAFAGLLAVLIALGGGALALQRLGIIRRGPHLTVASADEVDRKVVEIDHRLDKIDAEIASIRAQMDDMRNRLDRGGDAITELRKDMIRVGESTARVEAGINHLSATLEAIQRSLFEAGIREIGRP